MDSEKITQMLQTAFDIGMEVLKSFDVLMAKPEVAYAARPLDILTADGMRRVYVVTTVHEKLVPILEKGFQEALKKTAEEGIE